jgi:hypothetical protein
VLEETDSISHDADLYLNDQEMMAVKFLFCEELGIVVEVLNHNVDRVIQVDGRLLDC